MTNTYSYRIRTGLSLAQPTGRWTNEFGYDAAKRLTSVVSPAGTFTYTLAATAPGSAQIKKLLLPNTSYITNTYDGNARLLGTYLKNSSHTTLDKDEYLYNVGHQRIRDTRTDGSYYTNTYDSIGQLTVANSTVNSEDRGYAYDAAWNLDWRTNQTTPTDFSVDGKNQLTAGPAASYTYDGNGNLTQTGTAYDGYQFTYDAENRLVQVATYVSGNNVGQATFQYDGLGRLRTYQTIDYSQYQTHTSYIYDGMRVIQERNSSGTPTVSYTRGTDLSGSLEGAGGIGGLLGRSHGYSSGNWSTHNFYHADGNGNITYLVNSNQTVAASYRYDPYGNTISQSGSLADANTYRFSSKESVQFGMYPAMARFYYYGYRFYDPNLQRWLNRDPIEEAGGVNLYGYTANNPVSLIDPDGLECEDPCGQAKEMGRDDGDIGGVVCCGSVAYPCVWKSGGAKKAKNPKAVSIVDACAKAHESEHAKTVKCDCGGDNENNRAMHPPGSKDKRECAAYKVHGECLKNSDCGGDPVCEQEVRRELRLIDARIRRHCGTSRGAEQLFF